MQPMVQLNTERLCMYQQCCVMSLGGKLLVIMAMHADQWWLELWCS